MKKFSIIFDKVKREVRTEGDASNLTDAQKEALEGIDSFRMEVRDHSVVVSILRDFIREGDVIVDVIEIYSNTTEERRYRYTEVKVDNLQDIYRAYLQGRVDYDVNTGEYNIREEEEDILATVFKGKVDWQPVHEPSEFYIDKANSFMVGSPSFYGAAVFVFDGSSEEIFDNWDEVPAKVRNLTRYPIGFKKSKLIFDMAKYGDTLYVKGDSTIEASCPIQTISGILKIVGLSKDSKLKVIATESMQPAIGTLTHTGMSYGRWSVGRNPLPEKIVVDGHLTLELESKVEGFTIGTYGTNDLPMVYLTENAELTAPEAKGARKMEDNVERYSGSTKYLGYCRYYYD